MLAENNFCIPPTYRDPNPARPECRTMYVDLKYDTTIAAVGFVGVQNRLKGHEEEGHIAPIPRRYSIAYQASEDEGWTALDDVFQRSSEAGVEKAVFLDQPSVARKLRIKVEDLNCAKSYDFRVRVYGSPIEVEEEEEGDVQRSTNLIGNEFDGIVLDILRPDLVDCRRQAIKRGRSDYKGYDYTYQSRKELKKGMLRSSRDDMIVKAQGYNIFLNEPRYMF